MNFTKQLYFLLGFTSLLFISCNTKMKYTYLSNINFSDKSLSNSPSFFLYISDNRENKKILYKKISSYGFVKGKVNLCQKNLPEQLLPEFKKIFKNAGLDIQDNKESCKFFIEIVVMNFSGVIEEAKGNGNLISECSFKFRVIDNLSQELFSKIVDGKYGKLKIETDHRDRELFFNIATDISINKLLKDELFLATLRKIKN